MRVPITCILAVGIVMSAAATATDNMRGMEKMDSNNDNMVSREEYMTHHEKMWNGLKKTPTGMVSLKDIPKMKDHMRDKKKNGDMKSDNY